jgi:hypothetical protein
LSSNKPQTKPIQLHVGDFISFILSKILLHIHVWNTMMMGFRMLLFCRLSSPAINPQNPSNTFSYTSTCSGASVTPDFPKKRGLRKHPLLSRLTSYSRYSSDTTLSHPTFRRKPSANIYACQDQVSCI